MAEPLESYVTVDDLNMTMGTSLGAADPAAEFAIAAACQSVRSFLQRPITEVADDGVFIDGRGTDVLVLPNYPATEITLVEEDGDELVDEDDYVADLEHGLLFRPYFFWATGRRNILVEYSHGWPEDEVPADIRLVTLRIARRVYSDLGLIEDAAGTIKSETIGRYKYTLQTSAAGTRSIADPDPGEARILDSYINRRVRAN